MQILPQRKQIFNINPDLEFNRKYQTQYEIIYFIECHRHERATFAEIYTHFWRVTKENLEDWIEELLVAEFLIINFTNEENHEERQLVYEVTGACRYLDLEELYDANSK